MKLPKIPYSIKILFLFTISPALTALCCILIFIGADLLDFPLETLYALLYAVIFGTLIFFPPALITGIIYLSVIRQKFPVHSWRNYLASAFCGAIISGIYAFIVIFNSEYVDAYQILIFYTLCGWMTAFLVAWFIAFLERECPCFKPQ